MATRRSRGLWILVAGLLLTASACAPAGGAASDAALAARRPVVVNVTNHYNAPMEIYAVGSGTSYRMGTVFAGLASQFVLRQAMVGKGPVEFVARADGARPVRSDRILVPAGVVVDFEIGTQLLLSTVIVRP